MKTTGKIIFSLALLVLAGAPLRADQNSAQTLIKDGKSLLNSGNVPAAVDKFRQAADTGNAQAAVLAGDLLLDQAEESTGRNRLVKSFESGFYLFTAATNQQARACADLSRVFRDGIGVRTNIVSAYAWLELAARLDPSFRPGLDDLVVQLTPGEIDSAQACARDMQHGIWPQCHFQRVTVDDPRLRIQGLAVGQHGTLVILNDATFARGESGNVFPANAARGTYAPRLYVTCLDITSDYVLLAVGGEPVLRLLPLNSSTRL